MKKLFFLFAFLVLCAAIVSFSWIKRDGLMPLPPNEPVNLKKVESFVESESIEEAAYKIGYSQGEKAFQLQTTGSTEESTNFKEEQYTVAFELSPEQKKNYDEIVAKGYVDGYHKSSENVHCPGKTY